MRQEDARPFAHELIVRRAAPFAAAMAIAFGVAPLGDTPVDPAPLVAGLVLAALLAGAAWFVPWHDLPAALEALPPLAWFLVIALLRESQEGSLIGYGPLLLLPVLWLLLYGTRVQAAAAVAGVALTLTLPALAHAEGLGLDQLRVAIVWTAIASMVCVTVVRLVDVIRRQSDELERLASTDALTGLANRRVWEDALPRELARSLRAGTPVAIALIDVDHFREYNETLGHQAGDLLLKELAALWPGELRESDLLARHDGEVFALLLPDCGTADARHVVEKVRQATPAGVTCSAGVAIWDGVEEADVLVGRVGTALDAAKRGGRDLTVVAGRGSRSEPAGA